VAIRASYNVSSITDNGTGDYTVNFTSALADANYSANVNAGGTAGVFIASYNDVNTARTTGAIRVFSANTAFSTTDGAIINVAIFR
jgi:hypothetical protein